MRRLLVAVAAASLAVGAPSTSAANDGECADNNGVTVVVDFQELGGGVVVSCAPAPVKDGFDALVRAGVPYDHFQGAICRLYGKPENACGRYPPANAYWSYWLASRGGEWCYSNVGATRKPPPGSVDGWSFALNRGGGNAPPPRYEVPEPIPGQAPNRIAAGDCNGAAPAPAPTTTRPSASTGTSSPSSAASGELPQPAAAAAGVGPPMPGADEPTPAIDPQAPPAAGSPAADPVMLGVPVTTLAESPTAEGPPGIADDEREEASRLVSSPPPPPTSSPSGTAVALVIVTVLVASSIWLRRRQPRA